MENNIKITERGWAGHFCGSGSCGYRRNTLVENGRKKIVVSTVGNYQPHGKINKKDKFENTIGCDRYYETMVFEAKKRGVYWEADVMKEVNFKSNWALDELEEETDLKADKMHEKVVKEIIKKITNK